VIARPPGERSGAQREQRQCQIEHHFNGKRPRRPEPDHDRARVILLHEQRSLAQQKRIIQVADPNLARRQTQPGSAERDRDDEQDRPVGGNDPQQPVLQVTGDGHAPTAAR
jgi:hypothetical protein